MASEQAAEIFAITSGTLLLFVRVQVHQSILTLMNSHVDAQWSCVEMGQKDHHRLFVGLLR